MISLDRLCSALLQLTILAAVILVDSAPGWKVAMYILGLICFIVVIGYKEVE